MEYTIEYYSEAVEEAILNLPDGLLARYLRLADLMLEFGPNLGTPHTKAIGDGLFELRAKRKEGIARAIYCTKIGKIIIMLHVLLRSPRKFPRKN